MFFVMFNKNNIYIGLGIGIVIPLAAFFLLFFLFGQLESAGMASGEGFSPSFRQRTLAIVAICLNIIPFNIYQKRRFTQSMRGLAIATVIYAVVWLVYFGREIL